MKKKKKKKTCGKKKKKKKKKKTFINVRFGGLTKKRMEGIHTTNVSMKNRWFTWWNPPCTCIYRNCRTVTTHFVPWKSITQNDFPDQGDIKQFYPMYESPTSRPIRPVGCSLKAILKIWCCVPTYICFENSLFCVVNNPSQGPVILYWDKQ